MTRATTCVLLCAMALLAGCRLDAEVDVRVDGDGGGMFAVTVAADDELLAQLDAADADPLATLEQAVAELDGWQVMRRDAAAAEGTGAGDTDATEGAASAATITLSTRFDDPAELTRTTGAFANGVAGSELAPLEPFGLQLTSDTVALTGGAALRPTAQVSELALTVPQAEQRLADTVRMRVIARMPGRILQTNADERLDDVTAVWTVAAGQRRTLQVTSARPWSLARVVALLGGPWAVAAVALALTAIIGLAVWLLLRRRRSVR